MKDIVFTTIGRVRITESWKQNVDMLYLENLKKRGENNMSTLEFQAKDRGFGWTNQGNESGKRVENGYLKWSSMKQAGMHCRERDCVNRR